MRNKAIGTVVILLIASATPASATLVPMSFTTHLCEADCSDPASGTTTTGSLPNSPNASVTLGSSGAQVTASPSPDPSVLAAANAVGEGTDVRANILYQYSFEVFGAAAIVPVTVKTSISVGGTSVGPGGVWSSFAELSISGHSISFASAGSDHITPTTINLDQTLSLLADKVYLVNLYADAHAQSVFPGGASNGVFAAIDPTLSAPDGYSILLSDGISNGVPEPSTWAMMILGFAGIGFMAYRRNSKPVLMAA
jgi:hypothetical protein